MSEALVFCYDCDKWFKEKDTIKTDGEGNICFSCIKKRGIEIEIQIKKKESLEKWL